MRAVTAHRPRARPTGLSASRLRRLTVWSLLALALAVRLFRLAHDPLWLDEIYSIEVVRRGLGAILANSLVDPHPPLYYLVLWLASGFGTAQSEWAWRWTSAVFGALTVPVVYHLARRAAGHWPALIVSLWLAVSPTHLFFSQETRWPAFVVWVAALATAVLFDLQARPAPGWRWAAWAGLTVAGVFSSYSYLMIAGVQAPFVAWALRRQRGALLLVGGAAAAMALSAWLAAQSLPAIAIEHAESIPLTVPRIAQALLVSDPLRYGDYWAHRWLARGLALVGAAGAWHWLRQRFAAPATRRWQPALAGLADRAYPWLQLALPLGAYGLVLQPILGINLPLFEVRQFLVLLPAGCVGLALGLAQLRAWLPARPARAIWLGLTVVVVASSAQGAYRYWRTPKSPEGLAARYVRAKYRPDAAVVALHYSLDAAFSFYRPDGTVYTKPFPLDGDARFSTSLSVLRSDWAQLQRPYTVADIQRHPRRWVLSAVGEAGGLVAALTQGCLTVDRALFAPFEVVLVEACPPP